jgi:C_GCAxxG_C_C family probable redox protein
MKRAVRELIDLDHDYTDDEPSDIRIPPGNKSQGDTMNESKKAQEMFAEGHACSQALLAAFANHYDLPRETALKLAGSFGGGMGRQGLTCGAVTGALMVLGLDAGRVDIEDDAARDRNDTLVQDFFRRFQEKYGTLDCNELTGVQMSCAEARTAGKEDGTFDRVCPGVVGFAAELVTELLEIETD